MTGITYKYFISIVFNAYVKNERNRLSKKKKKHWSVRIKRSGRARGWIPGYSGGEGRGGGREEGRGATKDNFRV